MISLLFERGRIIFVLNALLLFILCIHPRHHHVNHIRDENHRDGQIGDAAVGFLNEGQQAELGDAEVHDAAEEGGEDFLAGDVPAAVLRGGGRVRGGRFCVRGVCC